LEAGSVPPSLNFPQLDFVRPSSGFHPVTWECVTYSELEHLVKLEETVFSVTLSMSSSLEKPNAHQQPKCTEHQRHDKIWLEFTYQ
jgi:hypothetical protein